jgi:hypothetical protein
MLADKPSKRNNRRSDRVTYPGVIRVLWSSEGGQSRSEEMKCLDASPTGMRLTSPKPIPLRTLVKLQSSQHKLIGMATVRHCSPKGLNFIVGLEFAGGMSLNLLQP